MLPLVVVAVCGIGVTRLALLALELHVRTHVRLGECGATSIASNSHPPCLIADMVISLSHWHQDDEEAARRQRLQQQQEEDGGQQGHEEGEEEREAAKARILWEMARRKKPAKVCETKDGWARVCAA